MLNFITKYTRVMCQRRNEMRKKKRRTLGWYHWKCAYICDIFRFSMHFCHSFAVKIFNKFSFPLLLRSKSTLWRYEVCARATQRSKLSAAKMFIIYNENENGKEFCCVISFRNVMIFFCSFVRSFLVAVAVAAVHFCTILLHLFWVWTSSSSRYSFFSRSVRFS